MGKPPHERICNEGEKDAAQNGEKDGGESDSPPSLQTEGCLLDIELYQIHIGVVETTVHGVVLHIGFKNAGDFNVRTF